MDGIVSTFPAEFDERVRGLWARLEETCGLSGVLATPLPHFSWLIGEQMDVDGAEAALARLAADIAPFPVRTTGLGVFTGAEEIVLYLAIVKDAGLLNLQRLVCERALPFFHGPVPYYFPENWVPHITIAHGDLTPESLACAARLLAREDLHWSIPVTGFELFTQHDGAAVFERRRVAFGG